MAREVPTYQLYGERGANVSEFWLHCETIAVRSAVHRWRIRPHRHAKFFQILHINHGTAEIEADGETIALRGPCAILMPAGVAHGFQFSPDVEGHVITIIASRVEALLSANPQIASWLKRPRLVLLGEGPDEQNDANFLAACVARFADEHEARHAGRISFLEALLVQMLLLIYRRAVPDAGAIGSGVSEPRITRLLGLINDHFREHRPVAFYAQCLGLSVTHLNRLAHDELSESVSSLIARRVVMEAKRNLVFTANPVQTVAYALGFSDPAYFSRFFLRHTGIAPLAYRQKESEPRGK
jgi:AraC family transcriptional activator of pobA